MSKYTFFIVSLLFVIPTVSWSEGKVVFGYDKHNEQIYAKDGNERATLNFEEDYTGNPAYAFDFFHGLPAIIADGRSLHDSTTYAVLDYREGKFSIDCLYYKIKSKQNGLLIKEGVCGLNERDVGNYQDVIDEKINGVESDMDSIDTSSLLTGKVKYLPVVIYKNKERVLYKVYADKQSLLDDKYSVVSKNNSGLCEVYENNPWVIYDVNVVGDVLILKDPGEKAGVIQATPSANSASVCSSYPVVSVKVSKAFLYNSNKNVKKAYLVKGDDLNVSYISEDGVWCEIKYINNKNKSIESTVRCQDLTVFK